MSFFSSPQFCRAVFAYEHPDSLWRSVPEQLAIENVEIDGRVLRLPVSKKAGDIGKVITSHPWIDYHEPVQNPDVVHRRGTFHVPNVALEVVPVESDDGLPETVMKGRQPAPFIQLDEFADFATYLDKVFSTSRYKDDERRLKKFQREVGPVTFTVNEPHLECGDDFYQALRWKKKQFPDNPTLRQVATNNLSQMLFAKEHLTVSTLRSGSTLLAIWIGFIHEGTWGGWIYSYNPAKEFEKFSFGRQLLYFMIKHAYSLKLKQFDFSIGGETYKWLFATHARLCGAIGRRTIGQHASHAVARGVEFIRKHRKAAPYKDSYGT